MLPVGLAGHREHLAPVQQPVQDGRGEVRIVEHLAPLSRVLVGGQQDRAVPFQVALVDHRKEDAGGVRAIAQIADFVDDQDVRVQVVAESPFPVTVLARGGELVDQVGAGGEGARVKFSRTDLPEDS